MAELTIAIPTYDRNERLLRTLEQLLPQLTTACELIILDNNSPVPVQQTSAAALARFPLVSCRIIRHRVNIGGNANIVRCFEICETPWLWVLGDDDDIADGAIGTILEIIAARPGLLYINFAAEGCPRERSVVTTGQEEFVRSLVFLHAIFISSCVYNHSRIKPRVNFGYQYAYSCAAQLLMVLMSMREGDRCLFSDKQIVHWQLAAPEQRWSAVVAWMGFPTILEVDLPEVVRKNLAIAIRRDTSLQTLMRELYHSAETRRDFAQSIYLFDQLAYRLTYFDRSLATKLKVWGLRLALRSPWLFQFLDRHAARCTGRSIESFRPPPRIE